MYNESKNVSRGFFEQDEFGALLAHTDAEDLKDFYWFAYLTGWRTGSTKSLEWKTVDLRAGYIGLESINEKTRQKNVMPLGEEWDVLYELIQRRLAKKTDDCEYVFHRDGKLFHRDGKQVHDLDRTWKTTCFTAGLVKPLEDRGGNIVEDDDDKPVLVHSKIPHGFRRTAGRNIYIATVSEKKALMITGHRSRTVFDRYNIALDSQKLETIRRTMAHLNDTKRTAANNVVPFEHTTSTNALLGIPAEAATA